MLLGEILSLTAGRTGDKSAVWHKGRWHAYTELERAANGLAHFLQGLGLAPGDRVGLLFENSPEYVIVHFAALKAGAVEVSLNHDLKGPGLRWVLEHSGATVLIASGRLARKLQAELPTLSQLRHLIVDDEGEGLELPPGCHRHALSAAISVPTDAPPASHRAEHDLASLVYTSGSTGQPKGVMLSHRNLASNTQSIVQYLGLHADDRMIVVLPFHYIYGRSLLYTHFFSGGSLVLDNRFAFPATILDTMQQQAVTAFAGVPSTFSILLHKTDVRTRTFPALRLITQAGGGMAPAVQREVAAVFHPARLFVMYGSTEAAPRLTYVEPELLPRKWGSIGRGIPGVDVHVVDESGARLPPRATGEIAARGPNIMLGYWKDPAGTARVLRDGYYFTGDLGYEDEDGFLFITGRGQEMIKTGGNRVSAKEIEDALLEIPGITEAAVIPEPDMILGEAIRAVLVVSDPAPTPRDILRVLSERLPSFKLPKIIEFREFLPKNGSGKVMKTLLTSAPAAAEGALKTTPAAGVFSPSLDRSTS